MTATEEFIEAQKTETNPCHGCDNCGSCDEAALYSHQHDGRYLCSKCFFSTPVGQRWPDPAQEESVEKAQRVIITLTEDEMKWCHDVGVARQEQAKNKPDKHGFKGDGVEVHVAGAQGELAAARAYNVEWPAHVGTYRTKPDLAPLPLEVRHRTKVWHDALVRKDDRDDCSLIHVVCRQGQPVHLVYGHISIKKAKSHKEWLQTHGDREEAYFVPTEALNPVRRKV